MNSSHLTTARWHLLQSGQTLPWGEEVSESLIQLIGDTLGYPSPATPDEDLLPIAPLPVTGPHRNHLVALCLGHARPVDQGNVGAGGVSEEEYNAGLIEKVAARLHKRGIACFIVDYYPGAGYESAMHWLARHLRDRKATAAIEFHFNASVGSKARGHEVLHWEGSTKGVSLGRCIINRLDATFPDQPKRGLKPRSPRDRGALFLSLTHCPACIGEPFFGDNPADWDRFDDTEESDRLADAYADGIEDFVKANP